MLTRRWENGRGCFEVCKDTIILGSLNTAFRCLILDRWSLLKSLARGCESLDLDQTHCVIPPPAPNGPTFELTKYGWRRYVGCRKSLSGQSSCGSQFLVAIVDIALNPKTNSCTCFQDHERADYFCTRGRGCVQSRAAPNKIGHPICEVFEGCQRRSRDSQLV